MIFEIRVFLWASLSLISRIVGLSSLDEYNVVIGSIYFRSTNQERRFGPHTYTPRFAFAQFLRYEIFGQLTFTLMSHSERSLSDTTTQRNGRLSESGRTFVNCRISKIGRH